MTEYKPGPGLMHTLRPPVYTPHQVSVRSFAAGMMVRTKKKMIPRQGAGRTTLQTFNIFSF